MKAEIINQDLVTVQITGTREEFQNLDTGLFNVLSLDNAISGKQEMRDLRDYFALSGLAYKDTEL